MNDCQVSLKVILLAGAASTCLFWQPASAQTTGQQTAQTGGGNQIEEVIVTARKREENLQTVPLAVTAVSGQELKQHQITDVYSLQSVTPSLQTAAGAATVGDPSFVIRGIGTAIFGSTTEASVGLVVDDVPMGRPQLANIQLFDINNVQILRGPQGMLFGKNASAGLIDIVTSSPELETTDFIAHAQYGSMSTPNAGNSGMVDAALNVPIGPDAALRVDGFFIHYDGFVKNVFQPNEYLGQDQGGARAKFLWEPASWAKVTLAGDFTLENGPGESQQVYRFTTPGGVVAGLLAAEGITASPNNDLFSANGPGSDHFFDGGASLKGEFDLGGGYTLTNVTAYRKFSNHTQFDDDALQASLSDFNPAGENFWQMTEELRITSPADQRFTYQGGLFFMDLDPRQNITFAAGLGYPACPTGAPFCVPAGAKGIIGGAIFSAVPQQSKAAYFEGTYKLLDSLRVTGGLRYTHDLEDFRGAITSLVPPTPLNFLGGAGPIVPPAGQSASKAVANNLSYRVIVDYDIASDLMAYGSYSLGYKGPGFNQANSQVVGPEIPKDWELGLKSTLLDDRLRLNLALFDETFNGFQAQVETLTNGVAQAETVNAGKLKSKGVELEATALPLDGLSINGGVTYNHTKLQTNPGVDFPCYPGEPPGNGVNQCAVAAPAPHNLPSYPFGAQNVDGNPLEGAPQWTETVTVRYEQPVWEGWTGFLQGNGYFRSPFNVTYYKNPLTEIGSSAIFGVSLGANSEDGHYGVSLFVRNLTDKRIPVYIFTPAFEGQAPAVLAKDVFAPGAKGDYAQQFDADSFRTVGISFDYHL